MPDRTLRNCRIIVVEDEYLLAREIEGELQELGAIVLGPVGFVDEALEMIGSESTIDGAILDVNLGGQLAFPVADLLTTRGVPFVFTTGYDRATIPERFASTKRCEKPINMQQIVQVLGTVVHAPY